MQKIEIKFILLGDSFVGKTQLSRIVRDKDYVEDSQSTVGGEYGTKTIEFERCQVKAHIWDTAGQERFNSMPIHLYCSGALGAVLVYDVCKRKSFTRLQDFWLRQAKEYGQKDIRFILVGNKVDEEVKREVSQEEAKQFAIAENMDFIETSAKTGVCVEKMFRRLCLSVAQVVSKELKFFLSEPLLPDGWVKQEIVEEVRINPHSRPRLSISSKRKSVDISSISSASTLSSNMDREVREDNSFDSFEVTEDGNGYRSNVCNSNSPGTAGHMTHNLPSNTNQSNSGSAGRSVDIIKVSYTNYWTGETQEDKPVVPADPGLLYTCTDIFEEDSRDSLDSGQTKPLTRETSLSTSQSSLRSQGSVTLPDKHETENFDDICHLGSSRRSRSSINNRDSRGSGSSKQRGKIVTCLGSACTVS